MNVTPTHPWHGCAVLVIHPGALGDGILVWPLLRTLIARGMSPAFATARSRADLAARVLGVRALDLESPALNALWRADARPFVDPSVTRLIVFMADGDSPGEHTYRARVQAAFPAAEVRFVGDPSSATRAALWCELHVKHFGTSPLRGTSRGPIIIHAGAGSRAKMLPLGVLRQVFDSLHRRDVRPVVIAGEAEFDRLAPEERRVFTHDLRGCFIHELRELEDRFRTARAFIGADTGPSHLAAQMGLPTLAIFGPTDPQVWRPVGPRVTVLNPDEPGPMDWLLTPRGAARIAAAVAGLIDSSAAAP